MQENYENTEAQSVDAKETWQSPKMSRIDIKRTLGGISGNNDGYSISA